MWQRFGNKKSDSVCFADNTNNVYILSAKSHKQMRLRLIYRERVGMILEVLKPSNIKAFRTLPTPFDNDLITSFEVTIILYPKWLVGYQNNSQMAVTKK